ncbi:hypothetical protein HOF56_01915 [Candidatus Peribacteria bacterium]|nr:hypothetical protein [Candidatus Peribacteria bacterium]MBT4473826.1 hypothetical protein [Candidatus Peribacteria bacterium]
MKRRAFINSGIRTISKAVSAAAVGSVATFHEVVRPKHTNGRHPALDAAPESLTVTEILYEELGHMEIVEKMARKPQPEQNSDLAVLETINSGIDSGAEEINGSFEPDDSTYAKYKKIYSEFREWLEWAQNFHLSEEQVSKGRGPVDCNEPAYQIPQKLSARGVPMYMISIRPRDPNLRSKISWHQFAACKGDRDYFLIYNKDHPITIWHGSLSQYVNECDRSDIPREVIPELGIIKFVEPEYDIALAKWWHQLTNPVSEEDMELSRLRLHHTQEPIHYA